jgi:hypothetical protein
MEITYTSDAKRLDFAENISGEAEVMAKKHTGIVFGK